MGNFRRDLRAALWPFLLSRLWVALWVYSGHSLWPYRKAEKGAWVGVDNWWLNPWTTYDSQHFLHIAANGYTLHTTPFFPLYPWLLRPFAPHEVFMAAWGVILSNACFFIALTLLYGLTQRDFDDKTARLCVWLLAFFPTTAIFSAVYTDSLYLLCLVAAFSFARRGAWWGAGAAAFFAALTRNAGPVIALALLFECFSQWRPGAAWGAHRRATIPVASFWRCARCQRA
jgi:hypothetical protein